MKQLMKQALLILLCSTVSYLSFSQELKGNEVVDIGTFGTRSHKISVRLSPLTIQTIGYPKLTLEQFWQKKKCLAIWEDE